MVAIRTATPEQVADCVLTLKRHIDRVEADNRAKDAEIKRLRAALGWYVGRSAESLMFDGGKRASAALGESDHE